MGDPREGEFGAALLTRMERNRMTLAEDGAPLATAMNIRGWPERNR